MFDKLMVLCPHCQAESTLVINHKDAEEGIFYLTEIYPEDRTMIHAITNESHACSECSQDIEFNWDPELTTLTVKAV